MSIFKNRHMVVAALVAPVLALMAYFGADYVVGERPEAAVAGQDYPLVEQPGCRYAGGDCGLKNADFELRIAIEPGAGDSALLRVDSVFPLDGVIAARVSADGGEGEPQGMRRSEPGGRAWTVGLPAPVAAGDRLRIVALAAGARYYGEVGTVFMQAAEERFGPQ